MNEKNKYFDISPKIIPSDQESVIYIKPLYDHCRLNPKKSYRIVYKALETVGLKSEPDIILQVIPENGILKFTIYFEAEQEHIIEVFEEKGSEILEYLSFRVYSLKDDLYSRRPYKGDIHLHSTGSDGRESPGYVAAACRKTGYDFMAITDHREYLPSLEAQKDFEEAAIDLKIFPGEEIHPPDNEVHIVNFGGRCSINEQFENEEVYNEEVGKITDSLDIDLSEDIKRQFASCVWCFEKIRQCGGIGVYCHPYWFYMNRYNVSENLNNHLFDKMPFDAYELISGYDIHAAESNMLQVSYYNEQRSKGKKIPVVGVSDAHGCERNKYFSWFYTIIFSHGLELDEIRESLSSLYSVAVEALPGQPVRVHGPHRLVKFALFCIREIFPDHDKLCFDEGNAMFEYLKGKKDSNSRLEDLSGSCEELMENHYKNSK